MRDTTFFPYTNPELALRHVPNDLNAVMIGEEWEGMLVFILEEKVKF